MEDIEKLEGSESPHEVGQKINEIVDRTADLQDELDKKLENQTTKNYSLAVGKDTSTEATQANCTAIGVGAKATGQYATAVGQGATASSGTAIGRGATTSNSATLAIGGSASASNAISIGSGTTSSGQYAISIGNQSGVSGKYGIGVGYNADATAENAIQLGTGTNSTANSLQVKTYQLIDLSTGKIPSDRIPDEFVKNQATADTSIAVGRANSAEEAVSIGKVLTDVTSGDYAIEVGYNARSTANYGIAIGALSNSEASQAIQLGMGTNSNEKTLQVFDYQVLDENGKIPVERYSIHFMPDYENGIDITSVLKASPYCYTPPTDGFIKFYTGSGEKVWNIGLTEDYTAGDISNLYYSNMAEGVHVTSYLAVYANQTIYATTRSGSTAIFYPLKGIN